MNKTAENTILLTILILLTLVSFTRTLLYILFDHDIFALDKKFGYDNELVMQGVLTIFAILRLLIATIILTRKRMNYDLITFALLYLVFTSFLRFYYEYLYFYKPESKENKYIDEYQDVNAISIFIASSYIIYYIFFH